MLTTIAAFFGLNVSKFLMWVGIILLIIALAVGGYFGWKSYITKQADLQFNNDQLKQTILDQQKHIKDIEAINQEEKDEIDALNTQNAAINAQLKSINEYLNSADAKKADRTSSVIIIQTIKKLSGQK